MAESREVFIEKLMAHVAHLSLIPKVQVERAMGPIIGVFIAGLLSVKWGKHVVMICEEFPLRKAPLNGVQTFQSTNIDWLLYNASDDQLVFLELKTTDTGFDPLQAEIYRASINRIRECGSSFLIEDLKEIMCVSLEREKYEEVLKCVQDPRYSNCRRAKLVYLAPAAMRDACHERAGGEVDWLSFEDLPEEVSGDLAMEWRIIRRGLLHLGEIARGSGNCSKEGDRRNYADTCRFEELIRLCQENGDSIVVGFAGGRRALRAATLDQLKERQAFKWDRAQGGTGFKDCRNWIPGRTFLELVEPLM